MQTLSATDARGIANSLRILSANLGDYRFTNWDQLSDEQRGRIEGLEWTLLNYSSDMTAMAISIDTDNVQDQLDQIKAATAKLEGVIAHNNDVRTVITIATRVVTLAASIGSGHVPAIVQAAKGLADELT